MSPPPGDPKGGSALQAAELGPLGGTARSAKAAPTNRASAIAAFAARQWTARSVLWIGAVLIGVILILAATDIVRSYRASVEDTGRQLETQARIIAEQTARSVQAVDVVLRDIAEQFRRGALSRSTPEDLHHYLKQQAVGLVQADGLAMHDADGAVRAISWLYPAPDSVLNIAHLAEFRAARDDPTIDALVGGALLSRVDHRWFFPIGRRLETRLGQFAGSVAARGSIDYFQRFYRDVQLDKGTKVTLMHSNGTLVARYPPMDSALGKKFPPLADLLASRAAGRSAPLRMVSPIDGVERFVALQEVPEYSLIVLVTRDTTAALAPWREQAIGTAVRTLVLAGLAALLLALVMRQLGRLRATSASLEASKERFAAAVAGSDDGIWDWHIQAGQVFASARTREIFGLPPGPEKNDADEWFASLRFHPDDRARRDEAMQAHLDGRTPAYAIEYRVQHRDGVWHWVRARGLCVRDASGRPQRIAGSVTDIDAQRSAEDSLRKSEERYAIAMTGSNEGHWVWDLETDELFASPTMKDIFELPPDLQFTTRDAFLQHVNVYPGDYAQVQKRIEEHLAGITPHMELEYRIILRSSGAIRWIQSRAQAFRDAAGRAVRVAGATIDISERKRAEEALRRSEERYQLAVDGSNEGLWDWDLASDEMFLSARAQELMGIESEEPVRPRREWVALSKYHPDDLDNVRNAFSAHLRGATQHFDVEYRMLHHSGDWHWYRQRGVAVRDENGRPYRMAGSIEDVTDRKNAETARDRLEDQLRQSQKLEAMGTLAGGIAHDFNNVLAAILGYGEMAQKDAPEGTPLRRHIDAAISAGMRAKSLVERILAFSRSGIGERVPVHVQSVVAEALDLIADSVPPGVRFERQLSAGDAAVLGDPTQIHQVVLNLCTNAIQALKSKGALTVALEVIDLTDSRTVSTGSLPSGKYVRLTVRDTGGGIAPQVLERIFDPFFTTKEVGVGTGLGLSLVHGIVMDLGGGVDVQSQLSAGATFTVYLPWQGDVAEPAAVAEEAIAGGTGETILLVDDEEALVRVGEEMLAMLGYEPVGFASSTAALETFRATPQRFDAVLSDEAMPELTGSELAKEIRKLHPDIPIVLMSGYVSPALSARAHDAGVIEVLAKPLVSRDIARSLASVLRR